MNKSVQGKELMGNPKLTRVPPGLWKTGDDPVTRRKTVNDDVSIGKKVDNPSVEGE